MACSSGPASPAAVSGVGSVYGGLKGSMAAAAVDLAADMERLILKEREATLAADLRRARADAAELRAALTNSQDALKAAKRTAREALIDMAEQNARLVAAYVEKKREVKQLTSAAREDRRVWQARLTSMETELTANKQHIQDLMDQLQAIAGCQDGSRTRSACSGSAPLQFSPAAAAAAATRAHRDSPGDSSASSTSCTGSPEASSSAGGASFSGRAAAVKQGWVGADIAPAYDARNANSSPLCDATNTRNGSAAVRSGALQGGSQSNCQMPGKPTASQLSTPGIQHQQQADTCAATDQQQQCRERCEQQQQQSDVKQHPCEARDGLMLVEEQQQQLPTVATQQALAELQQRARELEAENRELRAAQLEAEALRQHMQRMQNAEQLKQRGNRAYQCGRYADAAEAYTAALQLAAGDDAFCAVLLCNRAAAAHARGAHLDAVADCCLATALDPAYPRVLQRRAEAFRALGDHDAAAADLARAAELGGACDSADAVMQEARARAVHTTHAPGCGADPYLVLGLSSGASPADVKAAYKRLALKHHPDKVSGPHAKAAAEAVFVMVSAAHRVLSDPGKRAVHDAAAAATRARRAMATGAGHGGHNHAPHGRYYTAPRPAGSSASSGTGPSQWAQRPWTTTSGSGGMTYASYGAAAEAAQAAAAAKATQAAAAEQARWRAFYAAPPRTADGATSSSTASGASHY